MKIDFAREFAVLAQQIAGIDKVTAGRFETAIRAQYGGETLKISPSAPITVDEINAKLRNRMPVRDIAASFGVSRATIYRKLKAKGRKNEE